MSYWGGRSFQYHYYYCACLNNTYITQYPRLHVDFEVLVVRTAALEGALSLAHGLDSRCEYCFFFTHWFSQGYISEWWQSCGSFRVVCDVRCVRDVTAHGLRLRRLAVRLNARHDTARLLCT